MNPVGVDGQRILGFTAAAEGVPQTLIVLSNWQAELQKAASR